jgi:predicted secreted hydrolase
MTRRRAAACLVATTVLIGCTAGSPILANAPAPRPAIPLPTTRPSPPIDPLPVVLPREDGPHHRLMEWWYYTGHLANDGPAAAPGRHTFGFEFVIFRAERGSFPTLWASQLAITDETGGAFYYAQRPQIGEAVDRSPRTADGTPTGFDLALTGADPTDPTTLDRPTWAMRGSGGIDQLTAAIGGGEAAAQAVPPLGLDLRLAARKPAALHGGDGWIDFGASGGSYYYSRTSMAATGRVAMAGTTYDVTGDAWFDHQWGDFISAGGGGWDWFAVNLADGTDLMLYLIRDTDGSYPIVHGSLVRPGGTVRQLERDTFSVETTDRWRSPRSGADYPAGWTIAMPSEDLTIDLRPTVANQELDTRATSGVVYWEGSQVVRARRGTAELGGQAYVELTGYASSAAAGSTP